jgi:hypothetical protein
MRWFRRDHCHCGKIWLNDRERFLAGDDNRTIHTREKCWASRSGANWCQCGKHYLGAADGLYDHDTLLRHRRRPNHCETKLPEAFDPDPYWPDFPPLQHCPHGYIVSQGVFIGSDQLLHTKEGCTPVSTTSCSCGLATLAESHNCFITLDNVIHTRSHCWQPPKDHTVTTPDPANPKPGDRFQWRDYDDPASVIWVDVKWVVFQVRDQVPHVVTRTAFTDHAYVLKRPPLITEPVKLWYRPSMDSWVGGETSFTDIRAGDRLVTLHPDGTWTSDD